MSKYKIGFYVNSCANYASTNYETIDLVEDYDMSEKEAKAVIEDEEKLNEMLEEWVWETIETGYQLLETEEDIEKWERSWY